MSEPETPQRDEQPLDDTGHRASGGNDALNADDTHVARGVDENTPRQGPEHDAKAVYQQPDGTPKATGRTLVESVATVRIDCTNAPNDRVMIHIEHPEPRSRRSVFLPVARGVVDRVRDPVAPPDRD